MRKAPIGTALLLLSLSCACLAQQETCGLSKMTDTTALVYPPIARAARVEGNVIMLVNFKTSGEVEEVDILSGPEMLKIAASDYVKGWHANQYTGPRTCPIVVTFHLLREKETTSPGFIRKDSQHVTLYSPVPILNSDPSYTAQITKQRPYNCRFSDPNRVGQLYYEIPDHCAR